MKKQAKQKLNPNSITIGNNAFLGKIAKGIRSGIKDTVDNKIINGSAYDRGELLGKITVDVGIAVATTASEFSNANKAFRKSDDVIKITDDLPVGAKKIDDVVIEGGVDVLDFTYDAKKIGKQMGKRGWNDELIQETLTNPSKTLQTTDTRWLPGAEKPLNDPATAFIRSDGNYVVRNNKTGEIVQISNINDPNWIAPWDMK